MKNTGKIGEKSGKFVSVKKWEPWCTHFQLVAIFWLQNHPGGIHI